MVEARCRVLMVTARYFPYVGGTETHVYEVSRGLAARGMEITILTTMPHVSRVGRSIEDWQVRPGTPHLGEIAYCPTVPREEEVEGPDLEAQTLIISVGRLERYKGHQRLIRALPKLREWRANVRLLIVGVGPYEVALWALAKKMGVALLLIIGPLCGLAFNLVVFRRQGVGDQCF
jgi:hypothetical protein